MRGTLKFTQALIQKRERNLFRPSLGKGGNKMNNPIFSDTKHGSPINGMTLGSQQHITSKDVASYCMVSSATVRRWLKDGKLTSIRLPSNQCRISMENFRDFLNRYNIPIREELIHMH
jgi:excisionase family DNA binding protein